MVNLISTRTPEPFSGKLHCNLSGPSTYWCLGYFFPFAFVELHEIPRWPVLQPVKVHLNGSTPIWCNDHSSQFCIIGKLCEMHSVPSSRSLMKLLNSIGPIVDPWEAPVVTGLCLDFVLLITNLWAQQEHAIYRVFDSAKPVLNTRDSFACFLL